MMTGKQNLIEFALMTISASHKKTNNLLPKNQKNETTSGRRFSFLKTSNELHI